MRRKICQTMNRRNHAAKEEEEETCACAKILASKARVLSRTEKDVSLCKFWFTGPSGVAS